ncbi:ABC transporter permease subunit [Paenibacillus sp. HB172176]|uniref:ABC transporter permease n=1 Tax=Paenibacillus sp. HB172176 TaxID=2493690 RepID=UPI00143BDD31|nr:ABC transporter permease subunit [Paenibacillus sp. HB172176]
MSDNRALSAEIRVIPTERREGGTLKHFRRYWDLYLILLPGLLHLILFRYVPLWGILIAFQDYSPFAGMKGSDWVGLKHFNAMFHDAEFAKLLKNTFLISIYKIVWGFPGPILLALMLNEVRRTLFKRWFQTLVYLPHFLSWIIIGGILFNLLSPSTGVINDVLKAFGMEPILFLASPEWFRTILVASDLWKEIGWGTIIYLAALSSVDPQLYEAAIMDGANKWKQTIYITLPSIMGTIVILFLLRLGNILEVGFEQIFVLYNPLVYDVADVFETYIYREGITRGNFSYTTAIGLFQNVVGLLLVVLANQASKKAGQDGIW